MENLSKEEIRKRKAEYAREWRKKHPNYERERSNTPNGRAHYLLQAYKQKDKLHNRGKGDLTTKWIVENILFKPCVHCGKTGWDVIGCNRLDNSKPHTMDNVEPCCMECNNKLNWETQFKKVYQYTLDEKLVKIWESVKECEENGFKRTSIWQCCIGKRKTHNGYRWSYTPL